MSPKKQTRPRHSAGRGQGVDSASAQPQTLTVDYIGGQGDGVAVLNGRRVYLPRTVAGDVVTATVRRGNTDGDRGTLVDLLTPGPDRVPPVCRHFDRCGGCSVQHLSATAYNNWKTGLLKHALARAGLEEVAVAPLFSVPPGTRRRARFAAIKRGRKLFLGFNEAMSRSVVELDECPVLMPEIVAVLKPLRDTLSEWLKDGEQSDVAITKLDGGLDVLLIGPDRLDLPARELLASLAEQADIARLSWQAGERGQPEPVAHRRGTALSFGGVTVLPPPGGFLQAAVPGEGLLQDAVVAAVSGARKIADLFSGIGTFTFPITQANTDCRVTAVDSDGAAIAALEAASHAAVLSRISAKRRDLFRDPITVGELAAFDAVVLDPPRAGAAAQAAELARSTVPTVVMVSCSPASFARDARTLMDGGYRLESVQPVDQFLWSAHLELVGIFRRS